MDTFLNVVFGLFPMILVGGILLYLHRTGADTRRTIERIHDEKIKELEKRITKLEKEEKK